MLRRFFRTAFLDADDEGLDPVEVNVVISDIYRYFEAQVQAREVLEARKIMGTR